MSLELKVEDSRIRMHAFVTYRWHPVCELISEFTIKLKFSSFVTILICYSLRRANQINIGKQAPENNSKILFFIQTFNLRVFMKKEKSTFPH